MAEETYSPMIQHYLSVKKEYPYALLFYRIGDFYEMFFDDAKIASSELDLVLTGKNGGVEERIPMCGIPYHSADNYIAVFVEYIIYTSDRFRLVNNDCEHSNSVFHLTSGFRNI